MTEPIGRYLPTIATVNSNSSTNESGAPLHRWQHIISVASLIVGLSIGTLGVFATLKAMPRARVTVTPIATTKLADLADSGFSGISLTHDGEIIESASLVSVRIASTGNTSIDCFEADKDDPRNPRVTVTFGEEATILEAHLSRETGNGDDIVADLVESEERNSISVIVRLLNAGEDFHLNMLVASDSELARPEIVFNGTGVSGRVRDAPTDLSLFELGIIGSVAAFITSGLYLLAAVFANRAAKKVSSNHARSRWMRIARSLPVFAFGPFFGGVMILMLLAAWSLFGT